MQKIKVFNPDIGKNGQYESEYACETCNKSYQHSYDVWKCKTCYTDVCGNCKDTEHWNHNVTRDSTSINNYDDLDDDTYGFYYPIVDKTSNMNDNIFLMERDINPESLMTEESVWNLEFPEESDLNAIINTKFENKDYSSIILFPDGTIK